MHITTWRQIQNKKITTDWDFMTDYDKEYFKFEKKQKIKKIILGIALGLFILIALGLAGAVWARELKIKPDTLGARLNQLNWSIKKTFSFPVRNYSKDSF